VLLANSKARVDPRNIPELKTCYDIAKKDYIKSICFQDEHTGKPVKDLLVTTITEKQLLVDIKSGQNRFKATAYGIAGEINYLDVACENPYEILNEKTLSLQKIIQEHRKYLSANFKSTEQKIKSTMGSFNGLSPMEEWDIVQRCMLLDPALLKANIYVINKINLGSNETTFTKAITPYIKNDIFDSKFNATCFAIISLREYAKAYDIDLITFILINKRIFEHTGLYQIALDIKKQPWPGISIY